MDKVAEVLSERAREYGDYSDVASRVKSFRKALNTKGLKTNRRSMAVMELTAQMLAVKLARLEYQPEHEDTKIDIKGYSRLLVKHLQSLPTEDREHIVEYIYRVWLPNLLDLELKNKNTSYQYLRDSIIQELEATV